MMRQLYTYLIIAATSVLLIGCQRNAMAPTYNTNIGAISQSSARSYYYFTVAQLKLKQGDINESMWHLTQAIEYDSESVYLNLEMANLLLIKKEAQKALEYTSKVLAKAPDNVQALTIAGRIYQQQNNPNKAIEAYEKVLKSQPSNQGIYMVLGRLHWNNSNFRDAERVFRQMTISVPDSYAAHYFYGKALSAQGKLGLAEKALLKSIDLEGSLEEPRLELLKIYRAKNQPKKIIQTYQDILKSNPDNHTAAFGLAEQYRKMDQIPQSMGILVGLASKIDNDGSVVATLFERYLEPKQYSNARWALMGMLQAAPRHSDLHYLAGVAYYGLEKDDKALNHLHQVKPASRFYSNAVIHGAMILHDRGKLNRAIELVQQAISHEPDNIDYYLYLGSFFEELERYDEALETLQAGLVKEKSNGRLHFRAGVVYDKMGQKDKSIAAMKNVLKLSPNDAEALNYLGYTYADMGINLDEAEVLIQTALSIKPDDGYITDSLGWVYFKRGSYGQALELLNKAVKLIPDDPVILEHLGDVYLKMNSKEKALNYYQQSLKKKTTGLGPLKEKIRTLTHQ